MQLSFMAAKARGGRCGFCETLGSRDEEDRTCCFGVLRL